MSFIYLASCVIAYKQREKQILVICPMCTKQDCYIIELNIKIFTSKINQFKYAEIIHHNGKRNICCIIPA